MSVPTCSHGSADTLWRWFIVKRRKGVVPAHTKSLRHSYPPPPPRSDERRGDHVHILIWKRAPRNDQSTVINILSHLLSWCCGLSALPLGRYAPSGVGRINQQHHSKRCNNIYIYPDTLYARLLFSSRSVFSKMPTRLHVTLSEVVQVAGRPLKERSLWALLKQASESVQAAGN